MNKEIKKKLLKIDLEIAKVSAKLKFIDFLINTRRKMYLANDKKMVRSLEKVGKMARDRAENMRCTDGKHKEN